MRLIAIAMAIACALDGTAAFAQDYPPLINDLAQGYEFADGKSPDILGIAIGQPRTEAQETLKALFPSFQLREPDVIKAFDRGGNTVLMNYYKKDELSGPSSGHAGSMGLYLGYSTGINGERVTGISRREEYTDNQPAVADFVAALVAKFGEPARDRDNGYRNVSWAWVDGKLASSDGFAASNCESSVNRSSYDYFGGNREDDRRGCTAFLDVKIWYGSRPDLIGSIEMTLDGLQRYFDNGVATDAWLLEQVDLEAAAKGGGATPAL